MTKLESGVIVYQLQFGLPKYLLIHQNNGEWEFPKAAAKDPHQLKTTAIRAVKAKTNLDVSVTNSLNFNYRYRDVNRQVRCVTLFVSQVKPHVIVTPPRRQVMDYGWFDFRNAYRTLVYDSLRDAFDDANRAVRKGLR